MMCKKLFNVLKTYDVCLNLRSVSNLYFPAICVINPKNVLFLAVRNNYIEHCADVRGKTLYMDLSVKSRYVCLVKSICGDRLFNTVHMFWVIRLPKRWDRFCGVLRQFDSYNISVVYIFIHKASLRVKGCSYLDRLCFKRILWYNREIKVARWILDINFSVCFSTTVRAKELCLIEKRVDWCTARLFDQTN